MKARSTILVGILALALVPTHPDRAWAGEGTTVESAGGGLGSVSSGLPARAVEVARLAKAGVGDDVVIAFIKNAQSPYHLSAENILTLREMGLSSEVVAAMLTHDSAMRQSQPGAPSRTTPPASPPVARSTPPPKASPRAGSTPPVQAVSVVTNAPAASKARVTASSAEVPTRRTILVPRKTVIETPPPAARYEVVPLSPGPDFYWTPGYWARRGSDWIWLEGAWLQRPWPEAVWVGGHWARHGRGYVWVPGKWL